MQNSSLREKTFKGLSWSLLDNIANQGITFFVGIILARILSPEEYGVIGIIMIFIALFNGIVDCGLSTALIRKDKPTEKDYNTVFYSNLMLSLIMFFLLFSLSEPISIFFNQPLLLPVTKVMGIILVINSLAIIQRTILIKNINFKTQTKISLLASTISGLMGIMSAVKGLGVWSLVIQQVFRQLINALLLWFWSEWRPLLIFSKKSFNELFGYGWKLMFSNMINNIWNEIYQVVIGKCYSASILGQYTRAKQFNDIFSTNFTSIIQRVTFPVFSSIQDDLLRLKNGFKRILRITSLIASVLLFGLAGVSDNLINVLLGEKWLDAAIYLPIICMNGLFYPMSALNLNILNVQGRSDIYLKLEIVKKIIALIPIFIGLFFDIYWMLWASVVYGIIAYFINAYYSGKEILYSVKEQLMDVFPAIAVSILMYIFIVSLDLLDISILCKLFIQIIGGISFVLILLEVTKNKDYLEIKCIIKRNILSK